MIAREIRIFVNGKEHRTSGGRLVELLAELGIATATSGVAVAIENHVIPRDEWENKVLTPDMKIEIVHAVAGG